MKAKEWAVMVLLLVSAGLGNAYYTHWAVENVKDSGGGTTIVNQYITNETVVQMYITDGNATVSLMSLDKYQVVHSKIIIDANLPDTIVKVSVRVNNTFLANYLPYVWNNIREPAGLYNISVHAWDYSNTEHVDWSLVEIPKFEVYTPVNFTPREDIVIHANQTVIWRDGLFKVGLEDYYDNGLAITNVKPFAINIFGTLILYNMTMRYMSSITVQGNGRLVCENDTTFDWDNLLYRTYYKNDYSIIYVEDSSTLYVRNSTKNIDNTNLPGSYCADDDSTIYKESGFLWGCTSNDNGTVNVMDDISGVISFASQLL